MASQQTFEELFDPEFLAALEHFSLRTRRIIRSGRQADQLSHEQGSGLEFKDFKPYVPGDDIRAIDWNIYRRLGRLFVRVFEELHDLPLYLLIDRSSSMYLEAPPRIRAGLRSALALASIALDQNDSVGLLSFSDRVHVHVATTSGRSRLVTLAHRMAAMDEMSSTALLDSLREISRRRLRRGLLVVVSDFFDPVGMDAVTEGLNESRHELMLVQLTKRNDSDPLGRDELHGDVRMLDSETGAGIDITLEPAVVARYKRVYEDFNQRLADFAARRGAGLIRLSADDDVLVQLSEYFGSRGTAA